MTTIWILSGTKSAVVVRFNEIQSDSAGVVAPHNQKDTATEKGKIRSINPLAIKSTYVRQD